MECAWSCPRCTLLNEPELASCKLCNTARKWKADETPVVRIVNEERFAVALPGLERSVREWKIFDQFGTRVKELASQHGTCTASCGHCSAGIAGAVASEAPELSGFPHHEAYRKPRLISGRLDPEHPLHKVLAFLGSHGVETFIDSSMRCIQADRRSYIDRTPELRTSPDEASKYLSAWVANYEISDYLRRSGKKKAGVAFLRTNQMIDLDEATFEERDRMLVEEAPFGGQTFILEFLNPGPRKLLECSREVYLEECGKRGVDPEGVFWVFDLKGHFNTGFTTRFVGEEGEEKVVVMLDTISGGHCQVPAPLKCHELVFSKDESYRCGP